MPNESEIVAAIRIEHPDEIFVGGAWEKPATSDVRVSSVNPATEQVIGDFAVPGIDDADRAVAAARRAFDVGTWPNMSVAERTTILRRFTDAVVARTPEINAAWTAECGATAGWCTGVHEIAAPMMVDDSFEMAAATPLSEVRTSRFGSAIVERVPYGVALIVFTYNGPLTYLAFKTIPALLAGNTVVLKSPPETRLVAQHIAAAAEAADLPPGVLSVLTTDVDTSRHLVRHPDVDIVSFTGGTSVGSDIVQGTSGRLAKTVLELGGKCAGIIVDDVSTEDLIPMLLPGLLSFQGQVCVALTRLLVSNRKHDEVVAALIDAFADVSIGDPADKAIDFGPLAVERTRARCEAYVQQALNDGAQLATGGKRPPNLSRGWFYEPTLLVDVVNSMPVAQDEVFGPVFTVLRYDDLDDAVSIANESRYGLSAAIFTHDKDLALSSARRLRVGSVTQNSVGGVPGHPFGGFKQSGLGREMGPEGYLEWFQLKSIGVADRVDFMSS